MPFLTRQHIESLAKNEVSHTIKPKPVKQIRSFGHPLSTDILIDAVLQLIDKWEDAFLVLIEC
jgi:hypothetical protein